MIQSSNTWSSSLHEEYAPDISNNIYRNMITVGLSLLMTFSPITSLADPWSIEKNQRDAVVTMTIYHDVIGRSISRNEALRLSRQILEQAEKERLQIAELDAAVGIQWNNNDDLRFP